MQVLVLAAPEWRDAWRWAREWGEIGGSEIRNIMP
jgi:hypothetical protein